jgi:WG containing repeat
MNTLIAGACFVSLMMGTSLSGQDQVITYGTCSIDLEVPVLPKCALETRHGQLFVLQKFVDDVFAGRIHGIPANPVTVGRNRLASIYLDEGNWSYFNPDGLVVVQNVAPFDNGASEFQSGLVLVTKDGKWGLADTKGKFVVPMRYDGMLNNWERPGWLACSGCRLVHQGEHSWFSGGKWLRLDTQGRVAGRAKDPTAAAKMP